MYSQLGLNTKNISNCTFKEASTITRFKKEINSVFEA